MSDAPIRVVIADDHYLVREGTRQLLELDGAVEVVASVADATGLLAAVDEHRPDVVVTDIRMPPTHGLEGIEAAHALRRSHPELGIVVLSNHADHEYALLLFRDGMSGLGYLLKERVGDRSELLRAITATAAGGSVVDPTVVERLVQQQSQSKDSLLAELSPREVDVLAAMASGATNQAIARELHLSLSSVEKNVSSIFVKLGLTDERAVHRRVAAVLAYLAGH